VFVHNAPKAVKESTFYKCLEIAGLSPGTIAWPAEGREVRTVTIGSTDVPIALQSLSAEAISSQKRARLHDADLEAAVTSGPIMPVAVEMPAAIETLSPADAAVARARGRNREGGILLHRFLEVWDGTSPSAPLLARLAREAAASDDTMARVRQRIDTISRSAMMLRILRAETIGREMPIRYVDDGGAVVERRIDRLIREDGREIVIDYKSGSPDANRLESDRAQVTRYCAAIAAMTGRPCAGILWYIDLEADVVVEME
jgi:ATP-dependent exoDNAse (exonuclease V) beta subunit